MPKYQCPECDAIIKRAEAIPPGKKMRCPKCEHVFKAQALPEDAPPPPPPVPSASPKSFDDDEDGGDPTYVVVKEKQDEDREEVNYGSLRDKFAKSNIGPAMFITVTPSNWLLRLGLATCVVATFLFIVACFPLVFCEVAPLRPFIRPQVNQMIYSVILFSCGGIMCLGASRLHDLRSYTWAIIGSVVAFLIYIATGLLLLLVAVNEYGIYGLILAMITFMLALVGIWCIITILNKKVKIGFDERAAQWDV